MILADGYEDAFIGIACCGCGQPIRAVYDTDIVLKILCERDGMSQEDAAGFFEFNVAGAWVGEETPIWVSRLTLEEYMEALEAVPE